MTRIVATLRFAVAEFGPLLVFWILASLFSVKIAIAGSLAAILLDSGLRLYRRQPFTRLYFVVASLTLGFGAVDLCVRTPFLLVYEAPITNALTGLAFVAGAFGDKPMLQELAEQRPGAAIPQTQETRRFFRLFTLIWAAYFFLKAAGYLYLAATLPLKEALALRSVLGSLSLALMTALSVSQGRRLFLLMRRLGWLAPASA
jgi:intracellular septation protein A